MTLRIPFFHARRNRRFGWFDMLVYRLFYRVWSKHFQAYPDLRRDFIQWMQRYDQARAQPLGRLTLVPKSGEASSQEP